MEEIDNEEFIRCVKAMLDSLRDDRVLPMQLSTDDPQHPYYGMFKFPITKKGVYCGITEN